MGNIFLHSPQSIDSLREARGGEKVDLWKYEPIEAFVLVDRSRVYRKFIHVFIVRQSISQDRRVPHVAGFTCLPALTHDLKRVGLHRESPGVL